MADDSGQDKTEEPTEKKKQDSRDEGQVAHSRELDSLGVILAAAATLAVWFPGMARHAREFTVHVLKDGAGNPEALISDPVRLLTEGAEVLLWIVGPLLLAASVVAFVLAAGQVGFEWSWKTMEPKPERMDPLKGLKNKLGSKQALVEWLKSMAKVLIVAAVAWNLARAWSPGLTDLAGRDLDGSLAWTAAVMARLVGFTLLPMAALALADLGFQRWNTNEQMKMTREEVKREHKESDGDPHMKAKRRQRMAQVSQNRMLAEVATATVVVTNPSHYAVALRYEVGQPGPPVVVAAGLDLMAEKIKELARSAGVPRVENRPLARALHSTSPVGTHIRPELFEAVAEVLAFVFRLRDRHAGASAR
jgi:flagellar biosynthetic protein FlhB